jgi:hypothetical protein
VIPQNLFFSQKQIKKINKKINKIKAGNAEKTDQEGLQK